MPFFFGVVFVSVIVFVVPKHKCSSVWPVLQPVQSCIIPWVTVPDSTKISTDQNQIFLGHVFLLVEDVRAEAAEISVCIPCNKYFHK